MNLIDAFGKQPKSWMLTEAFLGVALVALIDVITPPQFGWLVFYAVPVFFVALNFPKRIGIGFAIFATIVGTVANLDSVPLRGWRGYSWGAVNRFGGLLFAAGCGISIQSFREETRRRMQAFEHAQELEREIVRAAEREQMRIGQDLHDGVCQTLAALDCAAQCLKMDLETEGSPQARLAAEIQKRLSGATLEARNLARGIYPVSIEGDGLGIALRELVLTTNALCHGMIGFESDEDIVVRDSEVAMHLYRITQEALSNAMRHSNATRVNVRLVRDDERLSISVADDGCGSAIQSRPDGMGWRTMRYRAKLIGAEIKVETKPSGGTTIRCSLPVPALAS
jgi:signal transduction histidine kinase